jgi:hypothetical protein
MASKKSCHPELVEIRDFEKPMGHGGKSPTVSYGGEREKNRDVSTGST